MLRQNMRSSWHSAWSSTNSSEQQRADANTRLPPQATGQGAAALGAAGQEDALGAASQEDALGASSRSEIMEWSRGSLTSWGTAITWPKPDSGGSFPHRGVTWHFNMHLTSM